MGKHYTIEFKLQVLQPILNGKMSIREAVRFYNIPSNALVGTWLKRFEKSGIKGLIPCKPSGRPPMKPKYAKMPQPPKTEEDRLRLIILQLEAEVACLKELKMISSFINTSFILGAIVFGLALPGLLFYRQKPVV